MADFGWVTVTTTCPVVGGDGTTDSRVFGADGESIYLVVECPEGHKYTIKVVMTVEGAATAYEHD